MRGFRLRTKRRRIKFIVSIKSNVTVVGNLHSIRCNRVILFSYNIGKVMRSVHTSNAGNVILFKSSSRVCRNDQMMEARHATNVPVDAGVLNEVVSPLNRPMSSNNRVNTGRCCPVRHPTPNVVREGSMGEPLRAKVLTVSSVFPVKQNRHRLVVKSHRAKGAAVTASAVVGRGNGGIIYMCITVNRGTASVTGIISALGGCSTVSCAIMMSSPTDSTTSLRCVTPCTKYTITRCFVCRKQSILVICSSLSGRTITCHALDLLLRHSPKHRTCPNSIFCLRSELLRHSTRLSSGLDNNDVATLPVIRARTKSMSTCVPAGVVSVASNRVFLRDRLFFTKRQPTVGMKLSISHINNSTRAGIVGGSIKAIHLSLTRCHRVRTFSRFNNSLSTDATQRLECNTKLVRLLQRRGGSPVDLRDRMVALVYTRTQLFISMPVGRVGSIRRRLVACFRRCGGTVYRGVRRNGACSRRLGGRVVSTTGQFVTGHGWREEHCV